MLDPNHDVEAHEAASIERLQSKTDRYTEEIEHPMENGPPLRSVKNLQVRFDIMGTLKAKIKGIDEPFVDAVLDVFGGKHGLGEYRCVDDASIR